MKQFRVTVKNSENIIQYVTGVLHFAAFVLVLFQTVSITVFKYTDFPSHFDPS